MIEIVPLKAWHLWGLDLQDSQKHMSDRMNSAFAMALERTHAMTALRDGKPIACAGIAWVQNWPRYAWALLGDEIGSAMTRITRACWASISRETEPVFTHVRPDIPANTRWLRAFGFEPTGQADFLPDGKSYELWVRRA